MDIDSVIGNKLQKVWNELDDIEEIVKETDLEDNISKVKSDVNSIITNIIRKKVLKE